MDQLSIYCQQLIENVHIIKNNSSGRISGSEAIVTITPEFKNQVTRNPDVLLWLSKIGYATRPGYISAFCWFLKCVNIDNPTRLLDLKLDENPRRRLFPAERLVETWVALAKQEGCAPNKIKKVLDCVRSFFRYNRVELIQVRSPRVRPQQKQSLTEEDLRRFREAFGYYGKILFDFLLSVPLRDGQFQICPNPDCKMDFHPRWRHITTYPKIEAYDPFIIYPQKGHENDKYKTGLSQVCFLTESAARALKAYKERKERILGRPLKPDEYIFTHQRNCKAIAHVSPITRVTVGSMFQEAAELSGIHLSPHYLRSWANSILASRGIDKQLRDIYLGHSCCYEQNYLVQMIPKWQKTFKEAKALEHLDLGNNLMSTLEIEAKLWQIEDLQKDNAQLSAELGDKALKPDDYELSKILLRRYKEGKLVMVESESPSKCSTLSEPAMSEFKGLSMNQQTILAALKCEATEGKQWCDVGAIMSQMKYGLACFEGGKVPPELTEAKKHIYWTSIRLLETRGLIVSRRVQPNKKELSLSESAKAPGT